MIGLLYRKPIDLVPLPIEACTSFEANVFATHMHEIHDDVQQGLQQATIATRHMLI